MRKIIAGFLIGIFFLCLFIACIQHSNSDINLIVFKTDNGWGYKINLKNKLYIYQPIIPAIEGNRPFHSKNDAFKTGKIVVKKIRNNQIPTVTKSELIKAGISF